MLEVEIESRRRNDFWLNKGLGKVDHCQRTVPVRRRKMCQFLCSTLKLCSWRTTTTHIRLVKKL
ncbi:hypothetical protein OESDEN_12656 [Oesophagostomum dentatum]|uniref:Uncharacterized protein n=1 Tax=Oesophagostomum dentatum TaxID=61180 RepID=A0A0B1SRK3_OESDE|nr:hypothetical protein OESDEN_12656 [Oesophagostomum dentatum]